MNTTSHAPRRHPPPLAFLLAAALAAAEPEGSARAGGRDLVERSPFVPSGWQPPPETGGRAAPPAPRADGPWEYRGCVEWAGEKSFALHEPRTGRTLWVALGTGENGTQARPRVLSHDPATDTILVLKAGGGARENLALKRRGQPAAKPSTPAPARRAHRVIRPRNPVVTRPRSR